MQPAYKHSNYGMQDNGQLNEDFTTSNCPSGETYFKYHCGKLNTTERESIKKHLSECLDCAIIEFIGNIPLTQEELNEAVKKAFLIEKNKK